MKVIINAFWLSSCRIAADLLSFVLLAVIARAFGPAGTGEYSYGFAIGTLVALIATSGFEDYGIRQYASARPKERPALWASMVAAQCVQLGVGALAFIVFVLVGAIQSSNIIVIMELATYVVGWLLSRTFFIPAMAAQAMVKPAVTDLICRTAAIISALILRSVMHATLPMTLSVFPIAGATLLLLSIRSASQHGAHIRPHFHSAGVIAIFRGTLPFAGADILNQFYARADILLIAYLLGQAQVGLYATAIKFVEVGLLPLILLGTAAYPLLTAHAARDQLTFRESARDFARLLFLLTGWLAVGLFCLVPLLVVPLFGPRFAASVALLPWVALFALTKGIEATSYRLLYSSRRQVLYCQSLLAGTLLIVILNWTLIPIFSLWGAILAAILSTAVVDLICIWGLIDLLGAGFLVASIARLVIALLTSTALLLWMRKLNAAPWISAVISCAAFPVLAALVGLLPHPRRSRLLQRDTPSTS